MGRDALKPCNSPVRAQRLAPGRRRVICRSVIISGVIALICGAALPAWSAPATVAQITQGLPQLDGLLRVFLDRAGGRVLLQLPPPGEDGANGRYVYQVYLHSGLGSAPVGLDRAQPGPTQILVFRQVGKRVLAEFENTGFNARSGNALEQAAVHQSFPASIVWSTEVLAEAADHAPLIDISDFLKRDAFGVGETLKGAKQGAFKMDPALSYPDLDATLDFPENLELEARQTFTGDEPGAQVKGIAPDAHYVTFSAHHSLIKLPPPGFVSRSYDPRLNLFSQLDVDYGAALDTTVVRRLALRFRLEKTDPTAARSGVKKPIIFYVDPAAPPAVRDALLQGAGWWAQGFAAAGFLDAFRMEVLPAGVNPLDARFNVINWVHRQTRGWSFGIPIADPRTGEIIKGSVLLGSLRMRQDRLIFEGLEGAALTGKGGVNDPIQIALARLRQLAVHETGHALGFDHNFAGSAIGDRASVMDYPAPRVKITGGTLDFSDAYGVGLGDWDRFALQWLYADLPPPALETLVRKARDKGLRFVADDDSRGPGTPHPLGALWDDGPDPVAALEQVMAVRRLALDHFGLQNLPAGAPVADLRRVIVPIYLYHRYQIEAAAKLIGGVDFEYAIAGDGHEASRPVPSATQRRALAAILATLDVKVLDLPESLLALLSSGQNGAPDAQFTVEVFSSSPVFSLPDAAEAAANHVFAALLAPARLNRMADMAARDSSQLSVGEALEAMISRSFAPLSDETHGAGHGAELRRRVQWRLVADLVHTMNDPQTAPSATAQIRAALFKLGQDLARDKARDGADRAQAKVLSEWLLKSEGLSLPSALTADKARDIPPGMPIGAGEDCWFCEVF